MTLTVALLQGGTLLNPLDEPARPPLNPDPAALDLPRTSEITIDMTHFLEARAGAGDKVNLDSFEHSAEIEGNPRIEPILGLISRSVESAVGFLELPHLRVLILLNGADSMSVGELTALMTFRPHRMFALLDAMEASGWVTSNSQARGVGEEIAISPQGQNVVDTITARRQQEIDEILDRISEADRTEFARAFNSFAAAAGEAPIRKSKRGIVS